MTLVTESFTQLPPKAGGSFARRIIGSKKDSKVDFRAHSLWPTGIEPKLVWKDGWLIEPVIEFYRPLWIWGAGHVGRAILDVLAPLLHFDITLVDSDLARFPQNTVGARFLPTPNIPDAVSLAPADANHLILTYSHDFDLEICNRLLTHDFAWAGLIGSDTKWARFRTRLAKLGHTDAQISRICCPIGQKELGKHPQAIAVGVAAQLLSLKSSESLGRDIAV